MNTSLSAGPMVVPPDFSQARVLVVGDVMVDRYWEGGAARISPEAPVPVVDVQQMTDRPGGAGNVALNVAALGGQVRLYGYVGDDAEADQLEVNLRSAGVDSRLERVPGYRTTTKLRVISRHQQLVRLDFEQALPPLGPGQSVLDPCILEDCDVLLLSDYAKGALRDVQPLIAAARDLGIPVLVDPKGPDFEAYRGATLLTPNLRELEAVVGPCADEAQLQRQGEVLIQQLGLQALLVTRSAQGMTLLQADQAPLHLPTRAREVFDVTGAGDTVIATLSAALASEVGLDDAVALANLAAGIAVGQLGAAAVSAWELSQAAGTGTGGGVLAVGQLQGLVERARQAGETVVFTNGCFDILHAGHVQYLSQAAALGQRLIVAVNSDESVRRLKGEGRPINPLERRMAVLAALGVVDWVVGFDEDTPRELLRRLSPDVLVKGGDYARKEDVVGWDIVEAYGGRVLLLDRVESVSTTSIVRDIQNNS